MSRRQLSVFIDESGDFGPYQKHSPYYFVGLVMHDQSNSISDQIEKFESRCALSKFRDCTVHTGPLIRGEDQYREWPPELRRRLFSLFYQFALHLPFTYQTFLYEKQKEQIPGQMQESLSRMLSDFLTAHMDYLCSFDEVVVYYDNGQKELKKILDKHFPRIPTVVSIRKIYPTKYRLFQVADLVCTLELESLKFENNLQSTSDRNFFHTIKRLRKDFLNGLRKKRI